MLRDIDRVLIDEPSLQVRVAELADRIAADLALDVGAAGDPDAEGRVVFIPIMTGAIMFTADLLRRLPLKLSIEMVAVSSYPGASTRSRGAQIASELPADLAGKHVVILDDILDSGRTMQLVAGLVRDRDPASVRTAVMLDKPARRAVDFTADYVGFEVPDAFVVGYGLDHDGYYRNLPCVATLKPEITGDGA